jgi:hypothetical protein
MNTAKIRYTRRRVAAKRQRIDALSAIIRRGRK